jgi:hypothetical protein
MVIKPDVILHSLKNHKCLKKIYICSDCYTALIRISTPKYFISHSLAPLKQFYKYPIVQGIISSSPLGNLFIEQNFII